MADRDTASDQLARILHLLALASRVNGASVSELAEAVDTSPGQVLRDLEEVYTRAYYHPAGSGEDTQILIDTDRVQVWTKGDFRRPARLSPGEALALGLGLRVLASEAGEEGRAQILELAERLEEQLSGGSPAELLAAIAVEPRQRGEAEIRSLVQGAVGERRRCRIGYLKPGAAEPDVREMEPYIVVAASGWWYVLGRCCRADGVKTFRLDRIVDVVPGETTFEIPADFDPRDHLSGSRVFRSAEDVAVTVRYSPKIARWIVEKGPTERLDDGSVLVQYRVADPHWVVRHVLQYGPDAELVGPAEYRELVSLAAGRLREQQRSA